MKLLSLVAVLALTPACKSETRPAAAVKDQDVPSGVSRGCCVIGEQQPGFGKSNARSRQVIPKSARVMTVGDCVEAAKSRGSSKSTTGETFFLFSSAADSEGNCSTLNAKFIDKQIGVTVAENDYYGTTTGGQYTLIYSAKDPGPVAKDSREPEPAPAPETTSAAPADAAPVAIPDAPGTTDQ